MFRVVKGKTPGMGDKVLVEAVYNGDLPFKWHATSVQTLGGGASTYANRGGGGSVQARTGYPANASANSGGTYQRAAGGASDSSEFYR